jgi:hypothetical protein
MLPDPPFHGVSPPDSAACQLDFRTWEVLIGLNDLDRTLPRNAEDLSELCDADEVMAHSPDSIEKY